MMDGEVRFVTGFFALVLLALCCQCQVVDEDDYMKTSSDIAESMANTFWSAIGWIDISDVGDYHVCQRPSMRGEISYDCINIHDFELWYYCIAAQIAEDAKKIGGRE